MLNNIKTTLCALFAMTALAEGDSTFTITNSFELAPKIEKKQLPGRFGTVYTLAKLPLRHSGGKDFIIQFKVKELLKTHLARHPEIFIKDASNPKSTTVNFSFNSFSVNRSGEKKPETQKNPALAYKDGALISIEYISKLSQVRCVLQGLDGTIYATKIFKNIKDLSIDSFYIKAAGSKQYSYGGVVWYDPMLKALFIQNFNGMYRRKANRWDRKLCEVLIDDLYYSNARK